MRLFRFIAVCAPMPRRAAEPHPGMCHLYAMVDSAQGAVGRVTCTGSVGDRV